MISVTEAAQEQVREYFNGKEVQPVRIFVNNMGCGGPSLAMALDEKKDTDDGFVYDGVEYIMEKDLMAKATPVKVDFTGMGFALDSNLSLGGGCSSCGSSGSCCGS